jgi:hypothetical protein
MTNKFCIIIYNQLYIDSDTIEALLRQIADMIPNGDKVIAVPHSDKNVRPLYIEQGELGVKL